MLGRISRASPQFISSSDGSWLGTSACIERMTQMSSITLPTLAKDLADFDAALAVLLELERRGERRAGLALGGQVRRRQRLAGVFGEPGLGSNVSTCEPAVQEQVDDVLRLGRQSAAAWAPAARRSSSPPAAAVCSISPVCFIKSASANAPKPIPHRESISRRVTGQRIDVHGQFFIGSPGSFHSARSNTNSFDINSACAYRSQLRLRCIRSFASVRLRQRNCCASDSSRPRRLAAEQQRVHAFDRDRRLSRPLDIRPLDQCRRPARSRTGCSSGTAPAAEPSS